MTSMWTTTSLVGAILGAAGFEGLWLRPSFAEGTEIQDENPMRIYAVAIYLSVRQDVGSPNLNHQSSSNSCDEVASRICLPPPPRNQLAVPICVPCGST